MPKYRQIIRSVERAIAEGRLRRHDRLPSVNQICLAYSLAGYRFAGIWGVKKGGSFTPSWQRIFRQDDGGMDGTTCFSVVWWIERFQREIYNSFLVTIDKQIRVDIYFHHFNLDMFKKLAAEINGNYAKYIIMPTNMAGTAPIIKTLPAQDVIILDQTNPWVGDTHRCISISHRICMMDCLKEDRWSTNTVNWSCFTRVTKSLLAWWKVPGILPRTFPSSARSGSNSGMMTFCRVRWFIIPNDRDLVNVIEQARSQQLTIGRDVGIISYNDIPLKKVVEKGITTISTDFAAMGRTLADFVMHGRKDQVKNLSDLIIRQTLWNHCAHFSNAFLFDMDEGMAWNFTGLSPVNPNNLLFQNPLFVKKDTKLKITLQVFHGY